MFDKREYNRRYYAANRDSECLRARRWQADNPERHRENRRCWEASNREKAVNRIRLWRKQNPDKYREEQRRRRARKYSATVAYFPEPPFADHCRYCGKTDLTRTDLHLDHVVPLSRGGPHTPDNVAWACAPCNMSKGAKLLEEWQSGTNL